MIEHVCPWTPKSSARGINSRRAANQRNRVPAPFWRGSRRQLKASTFPSLVAGSLAWRRSLATILVLSAALRLLYIKPVPQANGRSRRIADVADRVRGRLSWADSAPTRVASGRTGVRAIPVIPYRARNTGHRPKHLFIGAPEDPFRRANSGHSRKCRITINWRGAAGSCWRGRR